MDHALLFDCEFLTAEGAPSRFWCGPHDPDPVIAQIGAVRLGLRSDFPILDRLRLYVIPQGRDGARLPLDAVFTRLTGITETTLTQQAIALDQALARLDAFSGGARMWSWGKDECNMIAISCYVAGLAPPIPVTRFGNACQILLKAGMPYDEMKTTPSNRLAAWYGLTPPPLRDHDALDDALSVAYTMQHLLRQGALAAADFDEAPRDAPTRPDGR